MSLRCGCPDDVNVRLDGGFRDPTVFGPCWKCRTEPEAPPEAVDLVGALNAAIQRAREYKRSDFTLSPPLSEGVAERPFEHVLSDDCEPGDLG